MNTENIGPIITLIILLLIPAVVGYYVGRIKSDKVQKIIDTETIQHLQSQLDSVIRIAMNLEEQAENDRRVISNTITALHNFGVSYQHIKKIINAENENESK